MLWTEVIVYSIFVYVAIGMVFALWFVTFGIAKLDDSAKGTSIGFRFLIFFGAIPFWILLAWRILKGEKRPIEQNAHRRRTEK